MSAKNARSTTTTRRNDAKAKAVTKFVDPCLSMQQLKAERYIKGPANLSSGCEEVSLTTTSCAVPDAYISPL